MKTKEIKVAEEIANLTDDHWFNPAIFGRYLSEQPHYTTDRIMEMVVQIIKHNHLRYQRDLENGVVSEGLILANELYHAIKATEEVIRFKNLNMPN